MSEEIMTEVTNKIISFQGYKQYFYKCTTQKTKKQFFFLLPDI